MKKYLFITLLLIFYLSTPAWAGTAYYCDLSDSGSNSDGTFAEPFNSIKDINDKAFSTGDDLYFKADTDEDVDEYLTIDWTGTSGDRVIIGAYDGEGDFDITGSAKPILRGANQTIPTNDSYTGLIQCISDSITGYFTIQDLDVRESGGQGIRIWNPDYVIIQRCDVYESVNNGIGLVESHDSEVAYCYTEGCGKTAGSDYGDDGIAVSGNFELGSCYNIDIHHNEVLEAHEGIGVYKLCYDITVRHNVVCNNETVDIYIGGGKDIDVCYNLVYGTPNVEPIDPRHTEGIMSQNESWLQNAHSHQYPYNENIAIYGNLIAYKRNGIELATSYPGMVNTDMKVYNNTIIDCDNNIHIANDTGASGNYVYNNLFWCISGDCTQVNDNDVTGVTWSHNYYNSDPGGNANDNAVIDTDGPVLSKTSGWDSLTPGSVDGTEFALTSSSPCKDTGTDLGTPYNIGLFTGTDFSTDPPTVATASHLDHGEGTDIGAWIYDTGGPGPGGECTLSCEGYGTSSLSIGRGSARMRAGTENTSEATINVCKVEIYAKRVGTPTTVSVDVNDRDGDDLTDTPAHKAIGTLAGTDFPTGSPSWVEIAVDPVVYWEDGECLVVSVTAGGDTDNYIQLYYGTDTESSDMDIPERWGTDLAYYDEEAGQELAIKVYDYNAVAGAIDVDSIGTATVSGGIVTFALDRTDTDRAVGNPGYYFAVKLTEQPTVYSTPEPSVLRWDCGPTSTDYCDAPFYACLPDANQDYYLLYDPDLKVGNRGMSAGGTDPQLYGDGSEALIQNDAVIKDGDDNSLFTDGFADCDGTDLSTGTLTIAVPTTFYIAATGADFATHTALEADTNLIPGDTCSFNRGETFSEEVEIATSGISGSVITFNAYGTGDLPIITSAAANGIKGDGKSYITIQYLNIKDCGDCGINLYTSGTAAWGDLASHHNTISDCVIEGNAKQGILINGHYADISGCTFDDNGDANGYHNIYLMGSNGTIEDNIITNSAQGDGIRYEGADSTFQRNWIEGNHNHGISYSNDFPDTFSGNTCQKNVIIHSDYNDTPTAAPAAINIYDSQAGDDGRFTGINIYNNTIYCYDDETANQVSGIINWNGSTNVVIRNNIIQASDYAIGIVGTPAGFASDYNRFYDFTNFYYNAGNLSFANWQVATFDTNSSSGDPLWRNPAATGGDFHLTAHSPCKDAGTNVGLPTDYEGTVVPWGAGIDIGAYEYYRDAAEFTISATGDYATWAAFIAVDESVPGDIFTMDFTGNLDADVSGTEDNPITIKGRINGNVTIDEDYWILDDLNITGSLTLSGNYWKVNP